MSNIVLIHGMWSHPAVAEPLRSRLQQIGHHVVAPFLVGHDPDNPLSESELGNLSVSDYVAGVVEFIEAQEFSDPPILIGHSMGGLIAQMVAARISIRGIVLLNSAGPAGINHIFFSSFRSSVNVLGTPVFWRRPHFPSFRRARFALFNEMEKSFARLIHSSLIPESGRCFFEIVFWWLDPRKTTRITDQLDLPMLILSSGKDHIVHPSVSRNLLKRYPQADFRLFPDRGHWVFHEAECERIYEEIEDWIETIDTVDGSIVTRLHHEAPRSLSSTPVPAAQSYRLQRPLDRSGRVRGGADSDSTPDRGTILPG